MSGVMAVTIEYDGALSMKQRDINNMVRGSMKMIGLYWRAVMLKGHFTKAGAKKYGYTPRQGERNPLKRHGSYTNRKLREKHHTLPLVWSGKGRAEALASNRVIAKATAAVAKVTIPLPQKFNLRNAASNVHMADEIRAVTWQETRTLEALLVGFLNKALVEKSQQPGVHVRIAG